MTNFLGIMWKVVFDELNKTVFNRVGFLVPFIVFSFLKKKRKKKGETEVILPD